MIQYFVIKNTIYPLTYIKQQIMKEKVKIVKS